MHINWRIFPSYIFILFVILQILEEFKLLRGVGDEKMEIMVDKLGDMLKKFGEKVIPKADNKAWANFI